MPHRLVSILYVEITYIGKRKTHVSVLTVRLVASLDIISLLKHSVIGDVGRLFESIDLRFFPFF